MYETHFGLRGRPFRPTPDAGSYYPATSHEQALARLQTALAEEEGMVLLTGLPGTGKTLLCHCLLERLGDSYSTAFLTNSHVGDANGFLQAILHDLSLPYEGRGEQELRLALTDYLLKNYAEGRRTLLIVDEAQNLLHEALEELRLLGNLEGRHGKALQTLLVAQPDLLESLRQPGYSALRQRLAVRIQLDPFTKEEAADYLMHQIRAAGGRPEELLADEALAVLAKATEGVPRSLNQAAHQALGLAQQADMSQVDAEVAVDALALCDIEANLEEDETNETKQKDDVGKKGHTLYQPRTNGKARHGVEDGEDA
jgi:type II secretory pathway predicted ATPase ExeA